MFRLRPAYANRIPSQLCIERHSEKFVEVKSHTLALALVVCSRLSIVPDRADCAATSSGEDFLETAEEEDMFV
jgi:hypothetical protein